MGILRSMLHPQQGIGWTLYFQFSSSKRISSRVVFSLSATVAFRASPKLGRRVNWYLFFCDRFPGCLPTFRGESDHPRSHFLQRYRWKPVEVFPFFTGLQSSRSQEMFISVFFSIFFLSFIYYCTTFGGLRAKC